MLEFLLTMSRSAKALVTPEVLRWARESAGYSLEEAARSAAVDAERLRGWEAGEDRPTINQLRKLANKYKRPIAVFYLGEAPRDFQALRDFRRLPGQVAGLESPALRLEIRRAGYRRDVALDLFRELGQEPTPFELRASLEDDPERLAEALRAVLGVTMDQQSSWRSPYPVLNGWRRLVEQAGILVFQFSGVEIAEARGFSISDQPLPVVAVNVKDAPRGRVFSMLHEMVHVALRRGGLCDLDETGARPPEELATEVFCNRVAGAVLVPRTALMESREVVRHQSGSDWTDDELKALSRHFGASRETVLRRLVITGRARQSEYRRWRRRFEEEYEELRSRQAGDAPIPQDRLAISRVGALFARLVLTGYDQEKITASSVSDYLGVKLKHLGAIREDLVSSATGAR